MRIPAFLRSMAVASALATVCVLAATPAQANTPGTHCQPVDIPVALDGAVGAQMHGTLCQPDSGTHQGAIQVLTHGATYNSTYWDFPTQPEKYSYAQAAGKAGFATLNLDRIGYGGSTKVPSATLTSLTQANTLHQVISKLRAGTINGQPFDQVVLAGHSVGSGIAAIEASQYRDVDGLVLTGMTHHFAPTQVATALARDLYPTALDKRFAAEADTGYLTTQPGGRERLFYQAGDADPEVIKTEERTKEISSTTEIADAYGVGFTTPITQAINVPVLMVVGSEDAIFCQGPLSSDCTNDETVKAGERPYFPDNIDLQTRVIHGSGHDVALSKAHSGELQRTLTEWVTSHT